MGVRVARVGRIKRLPDKEGLCGVGNIKTVVNDPDPAWVGQMDLMIGPCDAAGQCGKAAEV